MYKHETRNTELNVQTYQHAQLSLLVSCLQLHVRKNPVAGQCMYAHSLTRKSFPVLLFCSACNPNFLRPSELIKLDSMLTNLNQIPRSLDKGLRNLQFQNARENWIWNVGISHDVISATCLSRLLWSKVGQPCLDKLWKQMKYLRVKQITKYFYSIRYQGNISILQALLQI